MTKSNTKIGSTRITSFCVNVQYDQGRTVINWDGIGVLAICASQRGNWGPGMESSDYSGGLGRSSGI